MQYNDALREWGALKLEEYEKDVKIERSSVHVELDFKQGYACCGGRDPDCYCSFAESPSANVTIKGVDAKGHRYNREIDHYSFDFATVLKEIVAAGGGTLTSWPTK